MTAPHGHPDAILRPKAAEQAFVVERRVPSASLAGFVDYHWFVGWDVPEPYRQQVVPQPRVHVAAEDGRLFVHGLSRAPFFRTLSGRGHTLGVSFLPGGFRSILGSSVGSISGRVVPAGDLLGLDDRPVARRILDTDDVDLMVASLEEYLLALGPEPDPAAGDVRDLVAIAETDHALVRAEVLAERAGMGLRSLQRQFTEYVGIGPKWVIQRYRILDAAAAAHSGDRVDWAALAQRLGFSDQAHLIRAFTQVVGTPPATYRRQTRSSEVEPVETSS